MALEVSGAEIVSPRDFRMTDGGGHSEYALVSTKIRLWAGPVRRIQREGIRDWRAGARFGPNASGAGASYANSVKITPPAMRETTVRNFLLFRTPLAKLDSLRQWKPRRRRDSRARLTEVRMSR